VWFDPEGRSVRGGFAFRRSALRWSESKSESPLPPFYKGGNSNSNDNDNDNDNDNGN
jgi:hypothetical protein